MGVTAQSTSVLMHVRNSGV